MRATSLTTDQSDTDAGFGPQIAPEAADAPVLSVCLSGIDEIDAALRREWRELVGAAWKPNPYFAQWFLEPAMRHLDPFQRVRLVLLRQAETGLLVGLLPIVFQRGYAKLPLKHACVWTHRHCFNGAPLIREGFGIDAYAALFDWIDTHPEGAVFLRFSGLPFDHETHETVDAACALRGREFRIQGYHERAVLSAENSFDDVMSAAMSGKKRKELRRQERRFGELGKAEVSVVPLDGLAVEGKITALCDAFLGLENAGWKNTDPEGFPMAQCIASTRFFREAMTAGAQEGAVECLSITLDGDAKAMLFTLRAGRHVAAFKTSYDEDFAAYSTGVRLLIEATRQMLGGDAAQLDSCARQGHPVVDSLWAERLPIVQINVPARRVTDKTLLNTAAKLEEFKNGALQRIHQKGA